MAIRLEKGQRINLEKENGCETHKFLRGLQLGGYCQKVLLWTYVFQCRCRLGFKLFDV